MNTYRKVLTVAGSDSGGGAGIQADIKSISANGCYALSVITALTAQNTKEVRAIHDVPVDFIADQIDAVLTDIGADAVKIGMLHNPEVIILVAEKLREYDIANIVLDPVMVAKSGDKLLRDEAIDALKSKLLPLARIITPNVPEAEALTGISIDSMDAVEKSGNALLELGAGAALIKGGHMEGQMSEDILYYLNNDTVCSHTYTSPRLKSKNTHGTGCTLSSAIAAHLCYDKSLIEAVADAKYYITNAINAATKKDLGNGHGPVHHFYKFWE